MAQIFKDSQHKDEAWPLAEWFQSTSFCDTIFNNIGWLPAYKPYFETVDPGKYPGLDYYIKSVEEANYWGPFIRCPIQEFVETKYIEVRERVFRGEMTGAEAAAKLQDDALTEWKQAGYE
jgi:ABC-type glycerol-3-phosphate transport system substrate-binding protein